MRRTLFATVTGVVAVVAAAVAAPDVLAANSPAPVRATTYTIGLFGDMPYGPEGRAEFPALRADMNAAPLAFSLFDGDLKSGSELCTNALYYDAVRRFKLFDNPVVVVPGDNDWTDCHRESNGSYNPEERLAFERKVFFSSPRSLGGRSLIVRRQNRYPENQLFRRGLVTYVGLNVQGSNNNFAHVGVDGEDRSAAEVARQDAEYRAREKADEAWLAEAFAAAKSRNDKALMIWWQADPNFNNEAGLTDPREYDGYTRITAALRAQVRNFAGQVVLVHGDSHYFRIDKPLADADGHVLANFTRVETFGATDNHWVSATIDPTDPNVFTFRPQIVAANVHP